jgi:hypothetical protein
MRNVLLIREALCERATQDDESAPVQLPLSFDECGRPLAFGSRVEALQALYEAIEQAIIEAFEYVN